MEFQHVWAVVNRHFRLLYYDSNRLISTFYWPLLSVLVWGFLGFWVQKEMDHLPGVAGIFLLGVVLWDIVVRIGIRMGSALMEEFWSYNTVNLFSSPLTLREWIAGIILFSFMVVMVSASYCIGIIWLLYPVSVADIIYSFLVFSPPLFIAGIWLGFVTLSLVIYFGKGAQELIFVVGWFFAPFSTAFYPLEALPWWAQKISYCLPMSYVFEGMRGYWLHQQSPLPFLLKAYALAIVYASSMAMVFVYIFGKSRQKGLARLND